METLEMELEQAFEDGMRRQAAKASRFKIETWTEKDDSISLEFGPVLDK